MRSLCFALASVLVGLALAQAETTDLVPEARSAVLLDQLSGRVLYQKEPHLAIPPASLTKLMTLHLTWKALESGRVHPQDLVPVSKETTGPSVPPGSSLMFLSPGQQVTVKELMLGLAVDSGNDAGMTLARFLAGDEATFVSQMNSEARALGLAQTSFVDSFGYDSRSTTTAWDFAQFSRRYLAAHPQAVGLLHSVRRFAYPQDANRAPGDHRRAATIVQLNRNTLLGTYPGADGLKTGFIDESGYNLAATAVRGNQRLVTVILGIAAKGEAAGSRLRTIAGARLLDYGFATYPLQPLPLPPLQPVRVWFSAPEKVTPAPGGPTVYPLAQGELGTIDVRVDGPGELAGPLPSGTVVGRIIWSKGGQDFYQVDLKSVTATEKAPWWTVVWDHVVLFFRGFTGVAQPKAAVPHT